MQTSDFSRISSSKVDRFTSNPDQNDHRPIVQCTHIAVNISPAKISFVNSNYPGEPYVAAANLAGYLLVLHVGV